MVAPPAIFKSIGRAGFTLIEMSIVLVIIGLIIGGVLVGKDLISAASVRAQISQIEKYQTAVNTFEGKYGYLPGDMPDPAATQYGFTPRGTTPGEGDGNGMIAGPSGCGITEGEGETAVFWMDLSGANLIDGGFNTASSYSLAGNISGSTLNLYIPKAKLGNGDFVYVWSGGWMSNNTSCIAGDGRNYFGLSAVSSIATSSAGMTSTPNIPVIDAYNIDKKVDDGYPQSGNVTAMYLNSNGSNGYVYWAIGGGGVFPGGAADANSGPVLSGDGVSAAPSPTTCYDNGGIAGGPTQYSLRQNEGAGANCALSFKMQGGN